MTFRQNTFYDEVNPGATLLAIMHADLIANGWQRVETQVDSGAFRWAVYQSPAANNSAAVDIFVAIGIFYPSGTAGTGAPQKSLIFTLFEGWNTTTKQASGFAPWNASIAGTNASGQPLGGIGPANLPSVAQISFVSSVTVTNPGSGYTSVPTVTLNPTVTGTAGTGLAVMEVSAVTVGAGGSGYPASQSALACTVSGGGGSGAVITATTNGTGVVTGYTIVDRGTGYTSPPTVTVTGGGSGATNTVTLRVKQVNVVNPGSSIAPAVSVSFSGGGGSGAAATATVNAGFAYMGILLGTTSTAFFYSITNESLALGIRADGVSSNGGVYVGVYERLLTPAQDPFPVALVSGSGGSAALGPMAGLGFSTREPLRGAVGAGNSSLNNDLAAVLQNTMTQNIFVPNPAASVDAYLFGSNQTQKYRAARATLGGRGAGTFWRGVLKGVIYSSMIGAVVTGDEITYTMGGSMKKAFRVTSNFFFENR
jgi:hypothetical protein